MAEQFNCECIKCQYEMKSEKHCKDIKCPECGGQMRRKERPGPGQDENNKGDNVMKQGIFMREYSADTPDVTVDVVGVIGWEVWYSAMRDILRQIPETAERVIFEIYSPGGDVWEGNAIIQEIGALKQKTLARIQVAASMGTLIAVACDKREIASNGRWLIHNPWAAVQGDAEAFEKRAKELRDCEKEAAEFYADRTGKTKKEMLALMDEERWLTPKEAKELGFVQKIQDPFDQAAFATVRQEIEAAGKWPKSLVEIPDDDVKKEEKDMDKNDKKQEGENHDANPTGTEGTEGKAAGSNEQPADDKKLSDEYKRGFDTGKVEAETNYATQLVAIAKKTTALTEKHDALDVLQRKTQGERDSARAQADKLTASLKEATDKLEQLLAGGMNFSPSIETWDEALKECAGDYTEARKKFPDLFKAQREQDKANRK